VSQVVIIEDHLLLAETLRAALAGEGVSAEVVAPDDPATLVTAVLEIAPTLVLLDLDLGVHGNSTTVIAPLATAGIRTLVVSGSTDRERIAVAFEAGAFGYHSKADGFATLVTKAAEALVSAEPLDEPLRRTLRYELSCTRACRATTFRPFAELTDRERETLRALSSGLSVHGIASEWVISEATVRSHVRGVLTKLDVPSQLAAVALALRTGWLAEAS
jgi:two-component system nitrate/nitrite response regulator NarL